MIDSSLKPPTNLRYTPLMRVMSNSASLNQAIGYFDADTPNGLADRDAFSVTGGKDADLFTIVPVVIGGQRRVGIAPTRPLVQMWSDTIAKGPVPKTNAFDLKVVARDRFGLPSDETTLQIPLVFDMPSAAAAPAAAPLEPLTPLQQLARDISLSVDPGRTYRFFDAYRTALLVPGACGAGPNNAAFLATYRSTFDREKPVLTLQNVKGFYGGLCRAWNDAVAQEQQKQAAAEAARAQVERRNQLEEQRTEAASIIARLQRNIAALVVVGALGAFLVIAMFLAFLAIEGHTRAVRQVMEVIKGSDKEGAAP